MPNYIMNRLTITGEQSRIDELYARFSTHYPETQTTSYDGELTFSKGDMFGWLAKDGSFSFRMDGKMEELQTMPDGWIPRMEAAWTRFPDFKKIIPSPNDDAYNDLPSQEVARSSPNWWYTWNCANWGVKWNCSDCRLLDANIWEFVTAWNGVVNIVFQMAQAFPELKIIYEFADEDTSSKCAIYIFEGGFQVKDKVFEYGTKEAYEHAFKLRPDSAQYYVLVDGNYEGIEDED